MANGTLVAPVKFGAMLMLPAVPTVPESVITGAPAAVLRVLAVVMLVPKAAM
jgi:hypothetical protein